MKEAREFVPSSKAATIFMVIYTSAFLAGVIGIVALPKDEIVLRKISLGVAYFFGLPVVVTILLAVLKKVGFWNGK